MSSETPEAEKKGHSSYLTWRIIKDRAVQKIIPSLGKKSNAQALFSIAMIIFAILGTVGFGIYLDGYVLHPPQTYTGICPAPAHIAGQKCLMSQVDTITQGSTTKVTTVQVPAGVVLTQNTTVTKTVTK